MDILKERYELVSQRIREIPDETSVKEPYRDFFVKTAKWLNFVNGQTEKLQNGWVQSASLAELQAWNRALYEDVLPENYANSYGNPAYAAKQLGLEYGQILSFLYTELRGMVVFVFENRIWDMTVVQELFVEVYNMFEEEAPSIKELKETIYWYISDYSEEMVERRIQESLDPQLSFAADIIRNADLTDLRYLYAFGEYISENELETARYLNAMSEEEIEAMARTYTEGYRIGFITTRKDITKKKVVNIRYNLGFERMIRAAIRQFEEIGLAPTIYRYAVHAANKRQHIRIGYCGAIPNKQFDYDHRGDAALFTDTEFIQRKLRVTQVVYEKYKALANVHGGPAVVEIFGEQPFVPENKKEVLTLTPHQQKLMVNYNNEAGQITNRYIKGEERSFTIIAYPIPEIGEQFPEIFAEIVKINNLDYQLYASIQQTIIDALDQGNQVWIKGCKENRTDLKIQLHKLENPSIQTNFENCVADVNIPVGEVFTSPVLAGTNGVLHVSQVYLNELCYKDLEITFKDGMIEAYQCKNFETEQENKDYIMENVLFHHDTLPMGEFAIGTNTTAYVAAKKYHIEEKLPILIAEKMGPHFAVGDTCYSWSEDTPVFNPDGKEIIARDNEVSLLRKSDVSKAYLGCHTDITIPYEELDWIRVLCPDGREISIIEEGRFVLPGTEKLNEPFHEV